MIDFYTGCLDLIFMWFSSTSMIVILPFAVMSFSVLLMLFFRILRK